MGRVRPVSRRSKPSSRSPLMGGLGEGGVALRSVKNFTFHIHISSRYIGCFKKRPHPLSPTLGGCCTPRMGRADVDVANRGVDGGSRPRRPCYPRGNFSVMPGPHRGGHERSLGHGFPAGPLTFKGPVRPAFALALYGGVLTRLSARGSRGLRKCDT